MKICQVQLRRGKHKCIAWLTAGPDLMAGLCIEIIEAPGKEWEVERVLETTDGDRDRARSWRATKFSGRLIRHD